jgi:hypothetical protein
MTKTFGRPRALDIVRASWKSAREVDPSPQKAKQTLSCPRYFAANAMPVATGKFAGMWLGRL